MNDDPRKISSFKFTNLFRGSVTTLQKILSTSISNFCREEVGRENKILTRVCFNSGFNTPIKSSYRKHQSFSIP